MTPHHLAAIAAALVLATFTFFTIALAAGIAASVYIFRHRHD